MQPNLVAPDTANPALTDSLGRLSVLARGLGARVGTNLEVVAKAIEQAAIDTHIADQGPPPEPVVDVATGTTTTTIADAGTPTATSSDPQDDPVTQTGTSSTTPTTMPEGD